MSRPIAGTVFEVRVVVALLLLASLPARAQVALSESAFRESGGVQGTVVLQVNWGRYWRCGPYENAQLQRLVFRRLADSGDAPSGKDWELSPFSTLLTKRYFEPYTVMVEPGEYALSGFRFKVAGSVSQIKVAEVDASTLIVDGKALGGSFTVAAGEIVYIGHFGVNCHGDPTPWRFYVEGKEDFARYADGFHKRYPFTKDVPVTFRLFQTEQFGKPYELPQ